jgi:dihydropteroate synthase
MLAGITSFKSLGMPVLAGVSRKSFIKHITGNNKSGILSGNLALSSYLKLKGVDIVRVHDVKQTSTALSLLEKIIT